MIDQHSFVFIRKGCFTVVNPLILNVSNDAVNVRRGIGECSKTFLPIERHRTKSLLIDPFGTLYFHILY